MNALTVLTIPFKEWKVQVNQLCSIAEQLIAEPIASEVDLEKYKMHVDSWTDEVSTILKTCFSNNFYVNSFNQSGQVMTIPRLSARATPKALHTEIKNVKDQLKERMQRLHNFVQTIEVCDLIKGEPIDLERRNKFTVQNRKDFLLQKLLEIDDGHFHELGILFEGNGIQVRDYNQLVEIAKSLENHDYIQTLGGSGAGIFGKITLNGQQYVEEQLIPYKEDYSGGPANLNELTGKINWIKEELGKHSAGQEVLFNEMEELKEMFSKMNNKTFGQLLKGKLIDLVLDKVISWETATMIFTALFGHGIKMIS